MKLKDLRRELSSMGNKTRAQGCLRFFKTGYGEYGYGDRFIGVSNPQVRGLAKSVYKEISDADASTLLSSPIHEERLLGVIIWTYQMQLAVKQANKTRINAIAKLYLDNVDGVNNWDLVDLSSYKILGPFIELKGKKEAPTKAPKHVVKRSRHGKLPEKSTEPEYDEDGRMYYQYNPKDAASLVKGTSMPLNLWKGFNQLRGWASHGSLWQKRIAMVSTYHFIKLGDYAPTIDMAKILLGEREDLLQKATGWMLREMGKADEAMLDTFLKAYHLGMGRTALRYAIERFPEQKRQQYLKAGPSGA